MALEGGQLFFRLEFSVDDEVWRNVGNRIVSRRGPDFQMQAIRDVLQQRQTLQHGLSVSFFSCGKEHYVPDHG